MIAGCEATRLRRVEPLADGWVSVVFPGGVFDTGRRSFTDSVEGVIRTPEHMVLVTLAGGAERLETATACGHRYSGCDRPGAVSFVPAHCERRLRMTGVAARWASISWDPFYGSDRGEGWSAHPFTNQDDPFVAGLVGEFERRHAEEGRLDPAYCEAMILALGHYMRGRHGERIPERPHALARWRLARIREHVEAHLDEVILVADLAALVGLSAGRLHRAFRSETGMTPLCYVTELRMARAVEMLRLDTASVAEVALRVGFQSPSRFARRLRRLTGRNPSQLRG